MSIANLFTPNNSTLYCNNLSTNEIDSQEYTLSSLGLFDTTTTPRQLVDQDGNQVTITLKYNYTGTVTLFYDAITSLVTAASLTGGCKEIKLGGPGANFNITGLPELRSAYIDSIIFINNPTGSVVTVPIASRLRITKVSPTTCNIGLYPTGEFFNSGVLSIAPFTFDYIPN